MRSIAFALHPDPADSAALAAARRLQGTAFVHWPANAYLSRMKHSGEAFAKERALRAALDGMPSVLLGFSGGVDSAYLGAVALEVLGPERLLAVVGRSASLAQEQWGMAREVAALCGIPLVEVDTGELDDPRYAANPVNRCYFCKSELWSVLGEMARNRGIAVVVDGTNADDLTDWRPGARAAAELGVRSPLADVGLTKDEIRLLSRARGLPTWSQPAAPCLSSRLPYGTEVTPRRLRQVERAEQALRSIGVNGDLRVRFHDELARVELPPEVIGEWLSPEGMTRLTEVVREAGFARVAVDLRGFRSGSLNVLEGVGAA